MWDDGGLGRGEGEIGLKRSRGVEDGIVVQVEGVNLIRNLRVGVARSHRECGMQLGGGMQGEITHALITIGIVENREIRGGLYLGGEFGGSFTRLEPSSIRQSPSYRLSEEGFQATKKNREKKKTHSRLIDTRFAYSPLHVVKFMVSHPLFGGRRWGEIRMQLILQLFLRFDRDGGDDGVARAHGKLGRWRG